MFWWGWLQINFRVIMGIFTKSVKDTVDSKYDPNTLKPVAVEVGAIPTTAVSDSR